MSAADPPAGSRQARWTVTTWNVHGSAKPDLGRVAQVVTADSPDIVLLQEIRRSQATALARATKLRSCWARKHFPYTRLCPWLAEGLAIMTPHTLREPAHAELTLRQPHRSWRRRIAQWALIARSDGSQLRAYNIHLSPHDAASRRAEAARLTAIVTSHGDHPSPIVGGDFNDDGDSSVIAALPGIEHVVPPDTSPAGRPTKLLDHVLLPRTAQAVTVTVPSGGPRWTAMSDHLPVTVRCILDV